MFRMTVRITLGRTTLQVVRHVAGSCVLAIAPTSVTVFVNRLVVLLFAVLVVNILLLNRPPLAELIVPASVMVVVNRCVGSMFTFRSLYIMLLFRSLNMEAKAARMMAAPTDVMGAGIR